MLVIALNRVRRGLLPSEGPVGGKLSLANYHVLIVLDDLVSSAHSDHIELNLTTDSNQTESAGSVWVVADDGGHGGGVSQVNTDVASGLFSLNHEERMDS